MLGYCKLLLLAFKVLLLLLSAAHGNKRCSKVVLHAWCTAHSTERTLEAISSCGRENVVNMQERRCRINEQGDFCGSFVEYLADIQRARALCVTPPSYYSSDESYLSSNESYLSSNESSLSSFECCQQLELLRDSLGCCINEVLNITIPPIYRPIFTYDLWSMCDLEPLPISCHPSPLANAKSTSPMNCTDDEVYLKAFQEACRRSTLQPLLEDYEAHGCNQVGEDQLNSCGVSEDGKWCVEKVTANISSHNKLILAAIVTCSTSNKCSAACRSSLMAIRGAMGCCLNMFNNSYTELIYTETYYVKSFTSDALWRNCGVDHPGYCHVKLLSAASPTYSFRGVILLTIAFFLGIKLVL